MAIELTDSNFKQLAGHGLALVDFGAEWCPPCKSLEPTINELAKEYENRVTVGKVDVDMNPEISMMYAVRNLPTIVILKDGKVVEKQVGNVPKANLVGLLNKHLS